MMVYGCCTGGVALQRLSGHCCSVLAVSAGRYKLPFWPQAIPAIARQITVIVFAVWRRADFITGYRITGSDSGIAGKGA